MDYYKHWDEAKKRVPTKLLKVNEDDLHILSNALADFAERCKTLAADGKTSNEFAERVAALWHRVYDESRAAEDAIRAEAIRLARVEVAVKREAALVKARAARAAKSALRSAGFKG